jgi:hypothetical protein
MSKAFDLGRLGMAVSYRYAVIERGRTVRRYSRRKRNLILDTGLDMVATTLLCNLFNYAVVGTGTNPVKRDSGSITFTKSGGVITASDAFFEAADQNRLIKFDSGAEYYITGFTSPTAVTVANTVTAEAASEGTIWYVNRTGLQSESKRTSTYATDTGANGTTYLGGTYTHKRTFIFSAEVAPVVYREIGWSSSASAGANLFGMDILPGGGVGLNTGQQLKVEVSLLVTVSPVTPAAVPAPAITGWTQGGTAQLESGDFFTRVTSGGGTYNSGAFAEPSVNAGTWISTASVALTFSPTGLVDRGSTGLNFKVNALQPYVSKSFTRTEVAATFGVTEANSSAIRSIFMSPNNGQGYSIFRVLLAANETKDSNHTIQNITWRKSWGRILQN